MTRHAIAAALLLASLLPGPAKAAGYEGQVVELTVTFQTYDPRQPWAKTNPRSRSAMAVVTEGCSLLTTAQMVADATLIQAEKFGSPPRTPVRVLQADPEVNLALLAPEDPTFCADLTPVRLDDALPTAGPVNSVRWRSGRLEVSASRVARIEVRRSQTSDLEHAFLRVKSDLGGGGWAEPVFREDRLVGLTSSQSEDLANVLPVEVVRDYLRANRAEGAYPGFGNLGFSWRVLRNRALAAYLGEAGPPRGVLVLDVPWGSSGCGALRTGDVLLELDGQPIDAEGYYVHPRYGRLRFTHIAVEDHLAGDVLDARVFRDGGKATVRVPLRRYPSGSRLIPGRLPDSPPPYFVAGGLVFRELAADYLGAWGEEWREVADTRLVAYWDLEREAQRPNRRRVVILAYVLPDAFNLGYHDLANLPVREVNGVPVASLGDVADGLRHPIGRFHRIGFEPNPVRRDLVLDAATFEAETEAILVRYGIPERFRSVPPPPDPNPPCPEPKPGER